MTETLEDAVIPQAETPEERLLRFHTEENELQQLLAGEDASTDSRDALTQELNRKHAWEEANNAMVSMEDFRDIEYMSAPNLITERVVETSHESAIVEPPQAILDVGESVVSSNEETHESPTDRVRRSFGEIIAMSSRKENAVTDLRGNGEWNGLVKGLKNLESRKSKMDAIDESALSPEDLTKHNKTKAVLVRDIDSMRARENHAQGFVEHANFEIAKNIQEVLGGMDGLPEDLRAVLTEVRSKDTANEIFQKYDLSPDAASFVQSELAYRRNDNDKDTKNTEAVKMERIARAAGTPELANYSRAEIEAVLLGRGISIDNIGEGIKSLVRLAKEDSEMQKEKDAAAMGVTMRTSDRKAPLPAAGVSNEATPEENASEGYSPREEDNAEIARVTNLDRIFTSEPNARHETPEGAYDDRVAPEMIQSLVERGGYDMSHGSGRNVINPPKKGKGGEIPPVTAFEAQSAMRRVFGTRGTEEIEANDLRAKSAMESAPASIPHTAVVPTVFTAPEIAPKEGRRNSRHDADEPVEDWRENDQRARYAIPTAEESFEIRESGRKNKEEAYRKSATDFLTSHGTATFMELKDAIGAGKNPTQQTIDDLIARGLIVESAPHQYTSINTSTSAPTEALEVVEVGTSGVGEEYIYATGEYKQGEEVLVTLAGVDYHGVLRAFSQDGKYAFIEGSQTGIPMEALTKKSPSDPLAQEEIPAIVTTEDGATYNRALDTQWAARGAGIEAPNWTMEGVEKSTAKVSSSPEGMGLDGVGAQWASFIAREYGIDIEADESAPRSEEAIVAHGEALESLVREHAEDAPVIPQAPWGHIERALLQKFEGKFGIYPAELRALEVYNALSAGQQMLVFKNLEQLTLSDITKEAKEKERAEWGGARWWKRGLQMATSAGMQRELRTAQLEKELLAASKNPDDAHRRAATLAHIEALSKVAAAGPDVIMEGGTMRINYISQKDIFESHNGENAKNLSAEGLATIEAFNHAATAFAQIPHEWRYATTTLHAKEEKQYHEAKQAFDEARSQMLMLYISKFIAEGRTENLEILAKRAMNAVDERVVLNQLFTNHPDAEAALHGISSERVIERGMKEFWKAKGNFIAYGMIGRGAVASAAGALAIPTMGASLLSFGLIPAVGFGVGRSIGNTEAKKLMRERRLSGRMSEEDEREEVEFNIYKHVNGVITRDEKGRPVLEGVGKRKIKEFTSATFFVDRIDALLAKRDQAADAATKNLIDQKIAKTTALMAAKRNAGMINFGGSGLATTTPRKGDVLANELSFAQALARGAVVMSVDTAQLEDEAEHLLGIRQSTIESKRADEIRRVANSAGLWRAAFGLVGVGIAEGMESSSETSSLSKIIEHKSMTEDADVVQEIVEKPKVAVPPIAPTPPIEHPLPEPVPKTTTAPQVNDNIPKDQSPAWTLKPPTPPAEIVEKPFVQPKSFLKYPHQPAGGQVLGEVKSPTLPIEKAPVIEARTTISTVQVEVGRPLSGGEIVAMNNLLMQESKTTDPALLESIESTKKALAEAMKKSPTPLTKVQISVILEKNIAPSSPAVPAPVHTPPAQAPATEVQPSRRPPQWV